MSPRSKVLGLVALLLSLLALAFSGWYFLHRQRLLSLVLPGLTGPLLDEFILDESLSGTGKAQYFGHAAERRCKITVWEELGVEAQDKILKERLFALHAMYRSLRSPYPGALSRNIHCDERFKPQLLAEQPHLLYLLHATERLTYGVCEEAAIRYRSLLAFVRCSATGRLFQVEVFLPTGEPHEATAQALAALACVR